MFPCNECAKLIVQVSASFVPPRCCTSGTEEYQAEHRMEYLKAVQHNLTKFPFLRLLEAEEVSEQDEEEVSEQDEEEDLIAI
uniref:Uncharacterized protein n=1 Tax=Ditylenchus dipsaci TaxID=166011 RepID=A0A915DH98_9BILA